VIAQLETRKEIIFEPGTGGGGSFWAGDNLLATLTVRGTVKRQGRLSIRDDNCALDLLCRVDGSRHIYQMLEGTHPVGRAEWTMEGGTLTTARLDYRGLVYILERTGLFAAGTQSQPVVAFAPWPDPQRVCPFPALRAGEPPGVGVWNLRQSTLHVTDRTDLPLIGFYVFVAHGLRSIVI
jgi:hypothetical protein